MATSQQKPLALVTGASSGIGYELTKQFIQNGYDVFIAAEDAGIVSAARSLEASGKGSVTPLQVDLASRDGVDKLWQAVTALDRPIEAVAINAGVGVGGPFAETDLDRELNMINLNVISSVLLAKKIVPHMLGYAHGKILITASIASIASTMPSPFEAIYGATKAFLLSLSDSLRNELRDTGVTVTALMPGPTDTNFFHRAGLDDTKVGAGKKDDPADVAAQAFKAMMDDDGHIVAASFKSKIFGALNEVLPESMKAEMHRNLSEPGSATKH